MKIILSTSGSSVLDSPSDLSRNLPKKDLQEVKSNELAKPSDKAVERNLQAFRCQSDPVLDAQKHET
jgi:hypothetical protein